MKQLSNHQLLQDLKESEELIYFYSPIVVLLIEEIKKELFKRGEIYNDN